MKRTFLLILTFVTVLLGCPSYAENMDKRYYKPAEKNTGYYINFIDDNRLFIFFNGQEDDFQSKEIQSLLENVSTLDTEIIFIGDELEDLYSLHIRPTSTSVKSDTLVFSYKYDMKKDGYSYQPNADLFDNSYLMTDFSMISYLDVVVKNNIIVEMKVQYFYTLP